MEVNALTYKGVDRLVPDPISKKLSTGEIGWYSGFCADKLARAKSKARPIRTRHIRSEKKKAIGVRHTRFKDVRKKDKQRRGVKTNGATQRREAYREGSMHQSAVG